MPLKRKKSLTSSTKVPLARLNIPSVSLSRQRDEGATTDDGMKSPLRASCTNKRAHRFPGFAVRCPSSYTFLMRAVVLPQLSGKSRSLARNIRCLLFSFYYPDFCAAVPALHIIIGIPALLRDNQPCFGIWCGIHKPPPAFRAEDRLPFICQLILFNLLLASAQV